jgi:hypothetical protein
MSSNDEEFEEKTETIPAADLKGKREPVSLAKLGNPDDHWHLHAICIHLPTDYEPYGYRDRDGNDCSCGCRWWLPLVAHPGDWGVCSNPRSPRCGLLTFEHQGCQFFDADPELDKKVETQIAELNQQVKKRREEEQSE